uniref:Putative secreted peptide n=1 Tax=Anopheles braziliensis TaxID=58242 RepID=A0A2M3ZSJ8_9DIPT
MICFLNSSSLFLSVVVAGFAPANAVPANPPNGLLFVATGDGGSLGGSDPNENVFLVPSAEPAVSFVGVMPNPPNTVFLVDASVVSAELAAGFGKVPNENPVVAFCPSSVPSSFFCGDVPKENVVFLEAASASPAAGG